MRDVAKRYPGRNAIAIGVALAGFLLWAAPTYADPACRSVPPMLRALKTSEPARVVPAKIAKELCPALSDKQLHSINGQGYTLRITAPAVQESVILWDEVTGGQGGGTSRVSAHSSGQGNLQTSTVTFSSR